MKRNIIFLTLISVLSFNQCFTQTTSYPNCNSNATEWTIESISVTDYSTSIIFKVYYTSDTKFLIHPNTYIQQNSCNSCSKYYIKEFVCNNTNTWYTAKANTIYKFTLKFAALPKGLTYICIREPKMEGANPWYWENITINNPSLKVSSSTSSMENFFKYKGVKIVAKCAHPTNTYVSGSYAVYDDYVWVNVKYLERPTKVKIYRTGNFFTSISVIEDDDPWMPPFGAIELIKDIVLDILVSDSEQKNLSTFEKKINKTLANMNGKDLTCLYLTLVWWDY